jgi:hypothetical protein
VAINSNGYESHLAHLVEGANPAEDERVGPREIKYFSQPQHNLILDNEGLMIDMRCETCIQLIIYVLFYECAQCKFFIHYRCTKLPTTLKRWLFHEYPLILLSQAPFMDGLFWCHACRRNRHGFTYRCDECGRYNLNVQCCLILETFEYEGHQHSLFLVTSSFKTSNACGEDGMNFVCTIANSPCVLDV